MKKTSGSERLNLRLRCINVSICLVIWYYKTKMRDIIGIIWVWKSGDIVFSPLCIFILHAPSPFPAKPTTADYFSLFSSLSSLLFQSYSNSHEIHQSILTWHVNVYKHTYPSIQSNHVVIWCQRWYLTPFTKIQPGVLLSGGHFPAVPLIAIIWHSPFNNSEWGVQ